MKDIESHFPSHWNADQLARAKTHFYQVLALEAHAFYAGKIQVLPRAPMPDVSWLNAWYTPGVSAISTAIRDDTERSFDLSWRGNAVAVVSDSTRVLGDGDVTPPGGLGVMEGKAYLMKMLGGVDAVPICVDSRNAAGENDPEILIDWVRRLAPSFGAINLEDISQPNCYRVLDGLRESCGIPVWHDDAQGTGCVTLAGLINALKVAEKELGEVTIVLNGAGAANTTIASLILQSGANPERVMLFDSRGGLHRGRADIEADARFYRKWELCETTNPRRINDIATALQGADVLIALSRPGPDVIRPEWVHSMAENAIVFACANPVPEIYPHAAIEAGALVVATGRGDFPNQINNSLGFPGILKGALLARASQITDAMAIAAARAIAGYAEAQGLSPGYIMPRMTDRHMFIEVAAAVASQAAADGVARRDISSAQIWEQTGRDIANAQQALELLTRSFAIAAPPESMIRRALEQAIAAIDA